MRRHASQCSVEVRLVEGSRDRTAGAQGLERDEEVRLVAGPHNNKHPAAVVPRDDPLGVVEEEFERRVNALGDLRARREILARDDVAAALEVRDLVVHIIHCPRCVRECTWPPSRLS